MITSATTDAALYVARNVRACDAEEIRVWTGDDAAEHVYWNAMESRIAWAVWNDDRKPVCLFGADLDDDGLGLAWMFSTDEVASAKWTLCRGVRRLVEQSRATFPKLRICFDHRKDDKRKFMEFCGFRWVRDFRVNGHLFREMQA